MSKQLSASSPRLWISTIETFITFSWLLLDRLQHSNALLTLYSNMSQKEVIRWTKETSLKKYNIPTTSWELIDPCSRRRIVKNMSLHAMDWTVFATFCNLICSLAFMLPNQAVTRPVYMVSTCRSSRGDLLMYWISSIYTWCSSTRQLVLASWNEVTAQMSSSSAWSNI